MVKIKIFIVAGCVFILGLFATFSYLMYTVNPKRLSEADFIGNKRNRKVPKSQSIALLVENIKRDDLKMDNDEVSFDPKYYVTLHFFDHRRPLRIRKNRSVKDGIENTRKGEIPGKTENVTTVKAQHTTEATFLKTKSKRPKTEFTVIPGNIVVLLRSTAKSWLVNM